MIKQVLIILISFTSLLLFSQEKKPYDYSMDLGLPIKIDMILAGNFCEMRRNHFHTGIDIKTNKKEGYRLYAIEDGYISRIKISPWGYGKAIYVSYNNGLTSVFAHCSRFPPLLDSLIYTIQKNQESAIIDENILPLKIPVKRGEIIAYSGNSGASSAPHLHFELRETKTEHAINPLLFECYKKEITDNTPPEIRGLKLYAITKNGYMIPGQSLYFQVKREGEKFVVNNNKTINIDTLFTENSQLGIGLYAIDKLDGAYNNCGIYSSELIQNDTQIHSQEINFMDFDVSRYLNTHKDYFAFKHLKQHIHKQFTNDINPLPIYPNNNGYISWNRVKADYQLISKDVHGNQSELSFKLEKTKKKASKNQFEQKEYYYPNQINTINLIGFEAIIEQGQFYEPAEKIVSAKPSTNKNLLSDTYQLFEYQTPVQSGINMRIEIPKKYKALPKQKMGIVLIDNRNRLYFQGGYPEDNWITHKIRHFGHFALAIDTIPPVIKALDYKKNQNISKYSTLEFNLSDNLSGLSSYKAYLNGKWVLAYYNRKQKRYIIPLNTRSKIHLVNGKNVLKIKAIDKMKNVSEQTITLIYQQ
ncbi:MAG: M23 family metallopeptidase [Crocinitomicaceae bacterium]